MKNHQQDSIFRKKGFFVALYACLGAVAVLALVITFSNFGSDPYDRDAALVGADQVLPYQDQQARIDEEAWFRPRPAPTQPPTPAPTPAPQPRPTQPRPPVTPEHGPQMTLPPPGTAPAVTTAPSPTAAPEADATPGADISPTPPAVVATFTPFTVNDRMVWPVTGEIAMDFSPNVMAFDPTFAGFRTNDDIRITAQEGTPVRAGADGRVTAIGHSVNYGHYVMLDHGNGWMARYGQLMEAAMVSVGEVVRAGQVIGGIGQPAVFGTMLGTHFNFRITQDGVAVNPHDVLEARD